MSKGDASRGVGGNGGDQVPRRDNSTASGSSSSVFGSSGSFFEEAHAQEQGRGRRVVRMNVNSGGIGGGGGGGGSAGHTSGVTQSASATATITQLEGGVGESGSNEVGRGSERCGTGRAGQSATNEFVRYLTHSCSSSLRRRLLLLLFFVPSSPVAALTLAPSTIAGS